MTNLTLGSLFDGSGGFPLGAVLNGIIPLWASEIEPFPIRVTTKRLPQVKHLGDISKIHGGEIEPVDIITFGSPCTDLSIAGRRDGLDGKQSSLFYEAIRIIKEMRDKTNGNQPRYAVWENVPGAFSSNKGADFKTVLEAFVGICEPKAEVPAPENGKWAYADIILGNGWSVAYRTIDAQHFGVPQRRRRIYLVADFTGESAGEILFEPQGVSRDFTACSGSWQKTSRNSKRGTAVSIGFEPGAMSRLGKKPTIEYTSTLRAQMGDNQMCVAVENHPTDGRCRLSDDGTVQTLTSRMGTGGMNTPLVMDTPKTLKIRSGCEGGGGRGALIQDDLSATLSCNNDQTVFIPKVYGICSDGSNSMKSDNPNSGFYEANTSRTVDANGTNPTCNQGGIAVVSVQGSMIGRKDENGPNGSGVSEGVAHTLNTVDKHAVAYTMTTGSFTQVNKGISPTLTSRDYKDAPVVGHPSFGLDRASFNQGQNALYKPSALEEQQPPLTARGPGAVAQPETEYDDELTEPKYVIRRLTTTECGRLQGFADYWCRNLETENPTDEDIAFWREVFETHRKIMGTSSKPKSDKQIIKWLKNPNSDSAEYKMWGNACALPCIVFVLKGIAEQIKATQ